MTPKKQTCVVRIKTATAIWSSASRNGVKYFTGATDTLTAPLPFGIDLSPEIARNAAPNFCLKNRPKRKGPSSLVIPRSATLKRKHPKNSKPSRHDFSVQIFIKYLRTTCFLDRGEIRAPDSGQTGKPLSKSNSLVMGDQTQIHQPFMNLCTNAAQAMEDL